MLEELYHSARRLSYADFCAEWTDTSATKGRILVHMEAGWNFISNELVTQEEFDTALKCEQAFYNGSYKNGRGPLRWKEFLAIDVTVDPHAVAYKWTQVTVDQRNKGIIASALFALQKGGGTECDA